MREERRLRVFENGVSRRIFGRKWDEVSGEWRKLHNEELNDLYSSLNILRPSSGSQYSAHSPNHQTASTAVYLHHPVYNCTLMIRHGTIYKGKVKLKFTIEQATNAQR